jgi:hypothetical protein
MSNAYQEYVHRHIEKYKKYQKLIVEKGRSREISPFLINEALAEYMNVWDMLTEEYQRYKDELSVLEDQMNDWYDEKFVEIRHELINEIESKTVKLAVSEIDKELKVRYQDVYREYRDQVKQAELKKRFILRQLDKWKKFDGILNTLSNNIRGEFKALSLQDRMNKSVR